MAGYYLKHDKERITIAHAARERVLTEHTYDKRMAALVSVMVDKYGSYKQAPLRAAVGD